MCWEFPWTRPPPGESGPVLFQSKVRISRHWPQSRFSRLWQSGPGVGVNRRFRVIFRDLGGNNWFLTACDDFWPEFNHIMPEANDWIPAVNDYRLAKNDSWLAGNGSRLAVNRCWPEGNDCWVPGNDCWLAGNGCWLASDDCWPAVNDCRLAGNGSWRMGMIAGWKPIIAGPPGMIAARAGTAAGAG